MHFRALWQAKFNAAFSVKVAENYTYSYEMQKKNCWHPDLLLLAQICTKSFVGWGFAPYPTGGAHSAPQDPLAGLWGWTPGEEGGEVKGGEGVGRIGTLHPGWEERGREWREGWGWEGREGERKEGERGRGNKHTQFKTGGAAHDWQLYFLWQMTRTWCAKVP